MENEETSAEIATETARTDIPLDVRIDEAENAADIALDNVDDLAMRLDELQSNIAALTARIQEIENDRSNARLSDERSTELPTADNTEAERQTSDIIKPNREHPYYRKLW